MHTCNMHQAWWNMRDATQHTIYNMTCNMEHHASHLLIQHQAKSNRQAGDSVHACAPLTSPLTFSFLSFSSPFSNSCTRSFHRFPSRRDFISDSASSRESTRYVASGRNYMPRHTDTCGDGHGVMGMKKLQDDASTYGCHMTRQFGTTQIMA